MARRPTDIIDYLPANVDGKGITRRRIEQTLKFLRPAKLWPDGRDETLNERHVANLIMALLGTDVAMRAAEAVKALADLPLTSKAEWIGSRVYVIDNNEPPQTFGEFLERSIRIWRHRGEYPWGPNAVIGEMMAWHGPPWRVALQFVDREPVDRGSGDLLEFGAAKPERLAKPRITEQRSVHGHIIGTMAEFLGPIGAEAKR